jgi:hypothetical protein
MSVSEVRDASHGGVKKKAFLDAASYSQAERYKVFAGPYCPHLQDRRVTKKEGKLVRVHSM